MLIKTFKTCRNCGKNIRSDYVDIYKNMDPTPFNVRAAKIINTKLWCESCVMHHMIVDLKITY